MKRPPFAGGLFNGIDLTLPAAVATDLPFVNVPLQSSLWDTKGSFTPFVHSAGRSDVDDALSVLELPDDGVIRHS
jgi:hypothetical protein